MGLESQVVTSRLPHSAERGRVRIGLTSALSNRLSQRRPQPHTPVGIHGCGDEQTLQQTYFRLLGSASCVQNFDDSLGFAIRITYRISLRSSSLWEPRHPLLKVFVRYFIFSFAMLMHGARVQ